MSSHMSRETRCFIKSFFANGAEMRSLIGMLFSMQNDGISIGEFAITFFTLELLPLAMYGYMLFQIRIGGKGLVTVITTEWTNFIVNLFKNIFD